MMQFENNWGSSIYIAVAGWTVLAQYFGKNLKGFFIGHIEIKLYSTPNF